MTFLTLSTITVGRRVHIARHGSVRPVCGGGRDGKSHIGWQTDVGPANCQRCIAILIHYGLKHLTK